MKNAILFLAVVATVLFASTVRADGRHATGTHHHGGSFAFNYGYGGGYAAPAFGFAAGYGSCGVPAPAAVVLVAPTPAPVVLAAPVVVPPLTAVYSAEPACPGYAVPAVGFNAGYGYGFNGFNRFSRFGFRGGRYGR